MRYFLIIPLFLVFFLMSSRCQISANNQKLIPNKFNKNEIINPAALQNFVASLDSLRNLSAKNVSVMHIGDSHIEIGQFSGEIKRQLVEKYGEGEEGWVFPYQLFNPQCEKSLPIQILGNWKRVSIKSPLKNKPLGVTGLGFFSEDSIGKMNFTNGSKYGKVTHVYLLHSYTKDENSITVKNGAIHTERISENTAISKIYWDSESSSASLQISKKDSFLIYAVKINPEPKNGITYHKFGVAGSTLNQFMNQTPLFLEQVSSLKPSLLIISLGTNDAYIDSLNVVQLKQKLEVFVTNIQKSSSKTAILFTTPPDTKYEGNSPKKLKEINTILHELTIDNPTIALWDLHQAMGGYDSLEKWKKNNLVNSDCLHFTPKGYSLQGKLFMQSLSVYLH